MLGEIFEIEGVVDVRLPCFRLWSKLRYSDGAFTRMLHSWPSGISVHYLVVQRQRTAHLADHLVSLLDLGHNPLFDLLLKLLDLCVVHPPHFLQVIDLPANSLHLLRLALLQQVDVR